jgi:hypothetical protein
VSITAKPSARYNPVRLGRSFDLGGLAPTASGANSVASALGIRSGATPFGHVHTNIASWLRSAKSDRLLVVAMAVQEPTLTYTNPSTGRKYLGAEIIFWSRSAGWLGTR